MNHTISTTISEDVQSLLLEHAQNNQKKVKDVVQPKQWEVEWKTKYDTVLKLLTERYKEMHMTTRVSSMQNSIGNCAFTLISNFQATHLQLSIPTPPFTKSERSALMSAFDNSSSWDAPYGAVTMYGPLAERIWSAKSFMSVVDDCYARLANDFNTTGVYAGVLISDSLAKDSLAAGVKLWRAKGFMEWLVRNKFGAIYMLPPAVNPNHSTKGNFSIVQSCWWIPPKFIPRSTSWRVGVINETRLPNKDEFFKGIEGKISECHIPLFEMEVDTDGRKIQAA